MHKYSIKAGAGVRRSCLSAKEAGPKSWPNSRQRSPRNFPDDFSSHSFQLSLLASIQPHPPRSPDKAQSSRVPSKRRPARFQSATFSKPIVSGWFRQPVFKNSRRDRLFKTGFKSGFLERRILDRKTEQGFKMGDRTRDRFSCRTGTCLGNLSSPKNCHRSCLLSLTPVLIFCLQFVP